MHGIFKNGKHIQKKKLKKQGRRDRRLAGKEGKLVGMEQGFYDFMIV